MIPSPRPGRGPRSWAVLAVLLSLFSLLPMAAQEAEELASPASVLKFAQSLYGEGDYRRASGEFLRYAFLLGEEAIDSDILFQIATCYQRSGEVEKALASFRAIIAGGREDEASLKSRYELAITEASLGHYSEALESARDPSLKPYSDALDPLLVQGWILLLDKQWAAADSVLANCSSPLAPELSTLAKRALLRPRRSPVLAGLLSSVLPGAGKLYAGRPFDALFSFGLVVSLGLLSGTNFAKQGLGSVGGWAYGSLALLFHAGNVYGSAVAAKKFDAAGEDGIVAQAKAFYDAKLR